MAGLIFLFAGCQMESSENNDELYTGTKKDHLKAVAVWDGSIRQDYQNNTEALGTGK